MRILISNQNSLFMKFIMRECRSGQTGQTQDLLAYAYGGPNPPSLIYILFGRPVLRESICEQDANK